MIKHCLLNKGLLANTTNRIIIRLGVVVRVPIVLVRVPSVLCIIAVRRA